MSARFWLLSLAALVAAPTGTSLGQVFVGGPQDAAEMRQRMEQNMKDQLGVKDEEWKVLGPKIDKVRQLQRDANPRPMMFFGPGGPGGPGGPPPGFGGGPGGDQQPSDAQQKLSDLHETLDNPDSTADQIKAKAQALRDARAQAKADLAKAQDDLKSIVTVRQEAILLAMGLLE